MDFEKKLAEQIAEILATSYMCCCGVVFFFNKETIYSSAHEKES